MREIKFRAWDYTSQIMSYSDEEKSLEAFFASHNKDYDDVVFMQFTGLKDNRGCEIYEGDVVKSQDCLYEDVGTYQIKWADEECGFWLLDEMLHCGLSVGEVASLHLEIIGNVFENPELIEETK